MLHLDQVCFSYGSSVVLDNVTTTIGEGEVVGIIGPSGAGKTTLLRILLGDLIPSSGSVHTESGGDFAIGYVPQLEAGERSFPITVEEMVLLGGAATSSRKPWFDRREKKQAGHILSRLGIASLAQRRLNELSGGQFQRALIGRALMAQPSFLLLDEPTSGIDLQTRTQVLGIVEELRREGFTIVLTTHDLNWVAAHVPRIICLNKSVIADGIPIEVLTPDVVRKTYNADMDVIHHNGRPVVVDKAEFGAER